MDLFSEKLPARLVEIIEDMALCEGQEKLELLLEYAEQLPEVPAHLQPLKDPNHYVHECITPIWVFPEKQNSTYTFHFDVPRESPTMRGYASILHEGTQAITLPELLAIPETFYYTMGLQTVLSGQRLHGIGAILSHMKRLAQDSPSL